MTDIQSLGAVQYTHLLAVTDAQGNPVFFTAAEVNSMVEQFGGGSHFLGMFNGSGHSTLEDSDDWADIEKFTSESIEIVKQHFKIS